jgi:DnaJ-class molecular chaperone
MLSAKLTKIESYAVLGITCPATEREAKIAFIEASRENHTNKGSDTEKQKSVSLCWHAYKVR